MTGLRLAEFADLLTDVLPRFGAAETERLTPPNASGRLVVAIPLT